MPSIENSLSHENHLLQMHCSEISDTILKKDSFTQKANMLALRLAKMTPRIVPDGRSTPIGNTVGHGALELIQNLQTQFEHTNTGNTPMMLSILAIQSFVIIAGIQNIKKIEDFTQRIKQKFTLA